MTKSLPARTVVRRPLSVLAVLGLTTISTACTPAGDFMIGSRDAAAADPAPLSAAPLSEREVEAPEVFELTDDGLWDGRPSLGGVWVAHADATDPERVIIRNTDTGSFVIGALFRRERELPGPSVQVSSEAAEALDILAGSPTTLQITALRTEAAPETPETPEMPVAEAPLPPATETAAETVTPAQDAASDDEAATLAAAATAAIGAAPAAAEPAVESTAAATQSAPRGLAAFLGLRNADRATPEAGVATTALPEPAPAPEPAPEPARNMSPEDIVTGIQPVAFSTSSLQAARLPEAAAADSAARTGEITAQPLPAAAPVTATPPAPADAPEATPVAARVPEPARVSSPASVPSSGALDRPFVQIGVFSVQENAETTGQALRNAGLLPTIHDQTSNGRQLWRVVVGPAPTAADRSAVLETVRGLGFGDAYFVAR